MKQPSITIADRPSWEVGRQVVVNYTNYTITDSDKITSVLINSSGTNRNINLPNPANNRNRVIDIIKLDGASYDAGYAHVKTPLGGTVNGFNSQTLYSSGDQLSVISDGSKWLLCSGVRNSATSIGLGFNQWRAMDTTHTLGGSQLMLYPGYYDVTGVFQCTMATYVGPTGGSYYVWWYIRGGGSEGILNHTMNCSADYPGTNIVFNTSYESTYFVSSNTTRNVDVQCSASSYGTGSSSYLFNPTMILGYFYRRSYNV